jgi:hypothetical protein
MNRKTIKRIAVAIVSATGIITITAGQASAGVVLQNHCEPRLHSG